MTEWYPNILADLSEIAGYSLEEMAMKAGVARATIYRYASGDEIIPRDIRIVLAKEFSDALGKPFSLGDFAPLTILDEDMLQLLEVAQQRQDETRTKKSMNRQRRQLTRQLAAAIGSSALFFPVAGDQVFARPQSLKLGGEQITAFTALNAQCWQWSRGQEMATVSMYLPAYLPQVAQAALEGKQKEAARIASEGHLLQAIMMLHQDDLPGMEASCRKAILFADIAQDINLHVASLIRLAVHYQYREKPAHVRDTYQQAVQIIEEHPGQVTPLLQGRVQIGYANALAACFREEEAQRAIDEAMVRFPQQPEIDLAFQYADCGTFSLYLLKGLSEQDMNRPAAAWETFATIEKSRLNISARDEAEIKNQQAETAILIGDLEMFSERIQVAASYARSIKSDQRLGAARNVYKQARRKWSDNAQVRELAGLFI